MGNFIFLIVVSLLPIVVLLWFFDRFDSERKEDRKFLWKIFFWGVSITLVAGFIEIAVSEMFLDMFLNQLIKVAVLSFIMIAAVEEGLKYIVVKKKAFKSGHFDEHIDGIVYGVTASLGFAALENILYVVQGGLGVGVLRAFTAVPAHALFGALMGYYISKAKFSHKPEIRKNYLFKAFLYPLLYHGLYDFFLLSPEYLGSALFVAFVIPLIIILYINVKRKIWEMRFLDKLKNSFEVKKWNRKRYISFIIGLVILTWSLISSVNFALYFAGDPLIVEQFDKLGVDATFGMIVAGLFFVGSYFLVREKRPNKK